jgi:hypothetical protein
MLARIVPGSIPPTFGAASIVETISGADTADLVTYGNTFTVSVTVPVAPPSWTFGYLVVLRGGATSAADSYDASTTSIINSVGTTNRTVTITSRTKNHHYRLWVYATDAGGNRTVPLGSSGNIQLTTLRYYRQRYRGVGSFVFDTVPARCDLIVVSAGSDIEPVALTSRGGFGIAFKNIVPPAGTFFYDLVKSSGGTVYVRRDSTVNTANQILGVNATNSPGHPTLPIAGSVTTNSGIFASPTYSSSGGNPNSGARINGDALVNLVYYSVPDDDFFDFDYGQGGILRELDPEEPGLESYPGAPPTIQVLYYD